MEKLKINVNSEIGRLKGVIVHVPGAEVENMTPENAERALYSDILNLNIALPEYELFTGVLKKFTRVFEVRELLQDIISLPEVKESLISRIRNEEQHLDDDFCGEVAALSDKELARKLIEGVEMNKNNLTRYLDDEHYCLHPLPNFFFTRDSSFSLGNHAMIARMANRVRDREAIIMETIFNHHPVFESKSVTPVSAYDRSGKGTIEGGDVIVASRDILVVGSGMRTTTQGIDALIDFLKISKGEKHILVQELPKKPESFIHLDMTFTFLDKGQCMIFEPLILQATRHLTLHVTLHDGKVVSIRDEVNLLQALKKLGMDLEPVFCGGDGGLTIQEREQWQSGANFFALEPGKVIGYERNTRTIEALNRKGYEVLRARDVVQGNVNPDDYRKAVITIKGNELSRGGGGARCMTMPVQREEISW